MSWEAVNVSGDAAEVLAHSPRACEVWLMQGVLSWVAQPTPGKEPARFQARLYEPLFRSPNPAELGDAWLDDLNPESLSTVPGALAPPRLAQARVSDRCVSITRHACKAVSRA